MQKEYCILFFVLPAVFGAAYERPKPILEYPFSENLDDDGNYQLYWKPNATHVTFEVHVKTRGYVGFGISPNGRMYPSDMIIAWVKDGVTHFTDRHSKGNFEPIIDKSQDWVLIHGEENDFGTVIKFARKIETCDEDDITMTDEAVRIIYAYHPDDPEHETGLPWHGVKRHGTKSIYLMSANSVPDVEDDVRTIDILNGNFHVPPVDTVYHCRVFSLDALGKKHHMVKFEAVIEPKNAAHVHHMLVYKCPSMYRKYMGADYNCYEIQDSAKPCGNSFFGWEIGAGPFYFPKNVGMPIGETDDDTVYIIETHYDNPTLIPDMVDNSGMRITYTPTLRQYDAGLLTIGMKVGSHQIIPPYEESFLSEGFCSEECLRQGLDPIGGEVKVIAGWQHEHLAGAKAVTRHFRNGHELKPLMEQLHYDFNYQETKEFKNEVILKSGDNLILECTYNSTWKDYTTFGGPSTRNEMCLGFFFYYPRMPLDGCQSAPQYDTIGLNQNELEKMDYSHPEHRHMLRTAVKNADYLHSCFGRRFNSHDKVAPRFVPKTTYQKPPSKCDRDLSSWMKHLPFAGK